MFARIKEKRGVRMIAEIVPEIEREMELTEIVEKPLKKGEKKRRGKKKNVEIKVVNKVVPLFHESIEFIPLPDGAEVGWVEKDGAWAKPQGRPFKDMEAVRVARNKLLRLSDWTQLADSPLSDSDKEAWKTYRAQLRSMPEWVDLKDVQFPEAPGSHSE